MSPGLFRRACYGFLSILTLLIGCLAVTIQDYQTERTFRTRDNPRLVISNAPIISIQSWDKNEVLIAAETQGSAVEVAEVTIKEGTNKLEISCHPSKPDRTISLTMRVPSKAVLDIKSHGNTVTVKEPVGEIYLSLSKDQLHLRVPESSALDMLAAPRATVGRSPSPGAYVQMGIGGRRMGVGPPHIKAAAPLAQIAVALGAFKPVTRRPTMASQTIARRSSLMSEAIRRSHPQLVRPKREQIVPARAEDKSEGLLKLETHLVNLNVAATDRAGKAIPGLTQDNFSVHEDGVPQLISFFSPLQSPFNLVLLLDLSGSMQEEIELIKDTAIHFLEVLGSQDNVAVVTFTTDVTVVSHLTKDRDELRESIDYLLAPAGGTFFYDALGYALVEELRKVKGQRNAVVVVTDGQDNAIQAKILKAMRPSTTFSIPVPPAGSFLTFEELLDGAMETDALIYPIHLDKLQPQQAAVGPARQNAGRAEQIRTEISETAVKQLKSLADVSGGRFYHADRINDLKGVFDLVAAELRTIYSIAYKPTNLNFDGSFRRVRVQVNQPQVVTRTRPGYYGR